MDTKGEKGLILQDFSFVTFVSFVVENGFPVKNGRPTNIYENNVSVVDIDQKTVIANIPSGIAPNGISFSALPAIPAPSSEVGLEIPERDMIDMPGMTP